MMGFHARSDLHHGRTAIAALVLLGGVALAPQRASAGGTGQGCHVLPTVTAEINAMGTYKSGTEERDPDAKAFNRQSLAGLDAFTKTIGSLGDAAMSGDAAVARCFGPAMTAWVATDPLTAPTSDQARFSQQWSLASTALAIIKAQAGGARIPPEVQSWLRTVSDQVRAYHDARSIKNNHAAWAALAVGAAAYILHDDDAWRWAMGREAMVTDRIRDDGVMPLELARGPRASNYHVFTAIPLLGLNLLRRCRGGLDARQSDRMQRLEGLLDTLEANQQLLAEQASSRQLPLSAVDVVKALEGKGAPNVSMDMLGGRIDNLRALPTRCR
ncbi:Alginate lyase [Methylorubrum salsuginis]|uniref:Alginate lyase n=1 Tax=Methylorubrum salsuginis TaxID=414703 RepID=A0A1I4APS3_9HYPH|nr:Alginate lyase [Methylorubrum salsuginis]